VVLSKGKEKKMVGDVVHHQKGVGASKFLVKKKRKAALGILS